MPSVCIRVVGCFCATLPNAFKQCAITLRIIHSALIEGEAKKPPEGGMNDLGLVAKTAHCPSALGIVAKEQGPASCGRWHNRLNCWIAFFNIPFTVLLLRPLMHEFARVLRLAPDYSWSRSIEKLLDPATVYLMMPALVLKLIIIHAIDNVL
jgi:hypothetical protein